MTIYRMLRRDPGSSDDYVETGQIYDDSRPMDSSHTEPMSVDDFVALRVAEDGWDYTAEPIE